MTKRVIFFDLLRCLAAVAVIGIHVLAPYRQQLGDISFEQWVVAVGINSVSRWAVPVFILITGALMLSDRRPFDARYYVQRRLGKVLLPFIVWSLFYAYLSGWSASGFDGQVAKAVLSNSTHHATYYHLGFFYYFIPLYFVIPFLQLLVRRVDDKALYALVAVWLLTTTLFLCGIDGPWSNELWLFAGYLPLGYLLYQKVPLNRVTLCMAILFGCLALLTTVWMVVSHSVAAGEYTIGRWLSYKTLNVVLAASMIFIVCRYFAERLPARAKQVVSVISQHSLGIYLLHPIFLWPVKEYGWDQGNPAWVIPLWILVSGAGSLAVSIWVARSAKTRWLLP
ncbi:acyltransferase family protein [Vibrio anguillarum]|uniref:acyltransferase n=1 Tax=Vibrio anguillarum TaxID=55601 RepID=UPI00097E1865|nr:acyltransferase family protein [Vibrio anguillarum]MBF4277039.1 acyltransferase [Vibrio anguillarum]MBF4284114.1 acyltransferase [Vibrio anguillarum]MBF4289649.1 acyltransferase [Vibrio anguillarum]MBF4342299.1 acyltransferase [Vibrio anguillarum]MBF4358899.1 acyltransferase [Vibrio anguillarum]